MRINPYLSFPGTCREAFAFYAEVLGGTIAELSTFGETPAGERCPKGRRRSRWRWRRRSGRRASAC